MLYVSLIVWVIKRSRLSFPAYITRKNDKSVIDSAALRGCTRLYNVAYDLPEEHWFRSMLFRVRFFLENPNRDFGIQKRILRFFGANPKTDHKSIQSTFRVYSSEQIQIQIQNFWDSQSKRFFGKGFEKGIFDKRFFEKKYWYATDGCRTCMTCNWTYVGGALLILRH